MNIQEFNWKEMVNNSKGKTSLMLVLIGIFGIAAALGFIACGVVVVIDATNESSVNTDINTYSLQCVALAGIVATLLGARRLTADKEVSPSATNSEPQQ